MAKTRRARPRPESQAIREHGRRKSCGKLVFTTRKKAIAYIQSITDRNPRIEPQSLFAYRCRSCGQWHTSTSPL